MNGLSVKIGKLRLKNPVMPASGTFGYGIDLVSFFNPSLLGAIVTKGLSLHPIKGNKPPRIDETPSGMLNSIGLANIGIYSFIDKILPELEKYDVPVVLNLFGKDESEFLALARICENEKRISAIELNLSCPNVKEGGILFGKSCKTVKRITNRVRNFFFRTLIVKLTPNVGDIKPIAKAAEEGGADAITLINTISAMKIDIKTKKPSLGNVVGGLSGPAIRPIAVKMVWDAATAVKIPIIGAGGITNYRDALEFMIAGASAVQVGTENFRNPMVMVKIINDLNEYLKKESISSLSSLTGSLIIDR